MKSPFYTNLVDNISKINNNMCFYLFLHEEVASVINAVEEKDKYYLNEYFSNNQYGKMNHIKLDSVEVLFEEQNEDYLVSIFIKIYTYMDYFLEELRDYLIEINSINESIKKR